MTARWARFARGWYIAGFATFVAALSHTLGGGAAPGLLPVVISLAFAGIVCIGLAGRAASLWRTTAAVLTSQLIFHGLFSLGASGGSLRTDAPAGTLPAHSHAAGSALLSVQSGATTAPGLSGVSGLSGVPGLSGAHAALPMAGMTGMSAAPLDAALMSLAHLLAAVVTIVALRHGERAFGILVAAARLVVRRVLVASSLPVRARTAHRVPAPTLVFLPRDLGVLLSVMRHRGPPETLRFA
ncbi:hypothetical protein E3O55_09710 [Cryobacterium sp. MDB1-18-2]|uniref:Integral membrane protein n=2 Tax=Cryobacterium TaxID=69578 RepID=A0ABY2IN16_9MICO|nr:MULTISPECIES: hypothetical protein [Cryobacterium]MEB0004888.1 hypothetical protein [Cryobacterium sp. RTC2.1]MEB0287549.1 hypothetical protein [Cryobacterium sp. 10S3]MEB0307304.1 hypothetical protein [Cryobacterium sp. 10I1]TFC19512.1 hypothetical protein E3O46_12225 [Cryobacterium glucosi]TFC29295.1 hypothetical protein E3O55_09710 [Cryobacterium sp. MDB1-18-2]